MMMNLPRAAQNTSSVRKMYMKMVKCQTTLQLLKTLKRKKVRTQEIAEFLWKI